MSYFFIKSYKCEKWLDKTHCTFNVPEKESLQLNFKVYRKLDTESWNKFTATSWQWEFISSCEMSDKMETMMILCWKDFWLIKSCVYDPGGPGNLPDPWWFTLHHHRLVYDTLHIYCLCHLSQQHSLIGLYSIQSAESGQASDLTWGH